MKLIVHAGAHKTATTSLQAWLASERKTLAGQKIHYVLPDQINQRGLIEDLHGAPPSGHGLVADRLKKALRPGSGRSKPSSILVSHESILSYSNLLPGAVKYGFYGSLENSAQIIHRLSDEFEIDIVFYVRRQDTFLSSVYMQYIKRGNIFIDFEAYLKQVDYKMLSWTKLLHKLEGVFGRERVQVRPFERISVGEQEFLTDFLRTIGVGDLNSLMGLPFPRQNEGLSQKSLDLMIACGRHLSPRERRQVGSFFRTAFSSESFRKASPMSADIAAEIRHHFAAENSAMFKRWMPLDDEFIYRP